MEPKKCLWISDATWLNLVQLSNIRPFSHIIEKINQNEKQWKIWFSKESPEMEPAPEPYHNLEVFKRLLLIRYTHKKDKSIIIPVSLDLGVQIEPTRPVECTFAKHSASYSPSLLFSIWKQWSANLDLKPHCCVFSHQALTLHPKSNALPKALKAFAELSQWARAKRFTRDDFWSDP